MPRPVPPDGRKEARLVIPLSPAGKHRFERMCKILGEFPAVYAREELLIPEVEKFEAGHALEVAEFERDNPPLVR